MLSCGAHREVSSLPPAEETDKMLSIRQAFPRPPFKSCHFPCLLHVVQRGRVPPARSGFKKQNHLTASPVLLCPDPFLSLAFSLSGTLGALESRKDTAPALPRGLPSSQAPAHSHPPSRPEPPPRSGGPTLSSSVFIGSFEPTIPSASDNRVYTAQKSKQTRSP